MPGDTGVDAPVAWPSLLEARVRVRKMQAKLHRWALADSGFRLDDAFNFICDPPVLVTAFERVAGNTGARTAGVDGVRAADVIASGVLAHLDEIRHGAEGGGFRPLPANIAFRLHRVNLPG
jgi:RNA-directed DNA polymerase